MRHLIIVLALVLTGCGAAPTVDIAAAAPSVKNPAVDPIPTGVVSGLPEASPSPSQSPSPSPSPLPVAPYSYAGSGTIGDPWQIVTPSDVQHIGDYPTDYFSLMNAIDMTGVNFVPIPSFSGILYGHSRTISHLKVVAGTAAFILTVSGTIVSLTLSNVDMEATGYATSFAGFVSGTLSGCSATGTILSGQGGNGFNVGIGNGIYTNRAVGAQIMNAGENLIFNGNHINTNLNF
jgi:hypothetical protein